MDQVLLDQFTLCILYITYIIIYKSTYIFFLYLSLHFSMIGYLTKSYSLDRVSIVRRYFFNLLFHLRFGQQFEKKRNKIDVLSEEPYPLRRGGATGRANRLMCDDRDDDARDGPALRSSGTRLVSERCPG